MFKGKLTGKQIKERNSNPILFDLGDNVLYEYEEKDTTTNGFPDHVAKMTLSDEEMVKRARIHELNTYLDEVRNTGIDVTVEQDELKQLLGL